MPEFATFWVRTSPSTSSQSSIVPLWKIIRAMKSASQSPFPEYTPTHHMEVKANPWDYHTKKIQASKCFLIFILREVIFHPCYIHWPRKVISLRIYLLCFVFKSSETEPHSSSDWCGTHYIIPGWPELTGILCLNHHTQLFLESNLVWVTLELKLEMLTQASSLF